MSDRAFEILGDLAVQARSGDDAALKGLVEAAAEAVRRWALVHTGEAEEANDLTQDVMIRMIRNIDQLPEGPGIVPWLYTVTRNAATDRLRKRSRQAQPVLNVESLVESIPSDAPGPAEAAEGLELGSLLHVFFDELPRRQREVFDLVELQGRPAAAVAELLGIRPSSVRANLFKARRRLRKRILAVWPDIAEDLR